MPKSYHDNFFYEVEQKKENAIDLLQNTLSDSLFNSLLLDTLTLDPTVYSTKELKKYFSDLVYSCQRKEGKIKISLLFEHKS